MSSGDILAGMSMMRRSIVWGLGSRVWHTRRHVDDEVVQVTPLRSADELLDEGRDFCTAQDERVDGVDESNLVAGFGFRVSGFGFRASEFWIWDLQFGVQNYGFGNQRLCPGVQGKDTGRSTKVCAEGTKNKRAAGEFWNQLISEYS